MSVADIDAHRAVEELREVNIALGPCGAAPLAALHRIAAQEQDVLSPNAVVVLLGTEGPRAYNIPHDSTTVDPVVLTQILTRIDSGRRRAAAHYVNGTWTQEDTRELEHEHERAAVQGRELL